jgi:hypothetical protein
MTTFKEIRGTDILALSSDPSNPELGQIWYNSSSGTLKGYKTVNVWSSGGNLNTARGGTGSAGTQTAGLVFGGYNGTTQVTSTESYNGSSWTSVNSMGTARYGLSGAGTQTSALAFGGNDPAPPEQSAVTESWAGTSWTTVNSLNTARRFLAGNGPSNTAALAIGGNVSPFPSPNVKTAITESWNGTSWTSVNSMNTARNFLVSVGTPTATVAFGGATNSNFPVLNPEISTATESYNGTSWTSVNSMNTARYALGGAGIQTAALAFGGSVGPFSTRGTATELWNGTSWTSNPTGLATARETTGAGTQSAALAIGGYSSATPNISSATEEWDSVKVQTITVS